jgi:hypothetical protein
MDIEKSESSFLDNITWLGESDNNEQWIIPRNIWRVGIRLKKGQRQHDAEGYGGRS